MKKARGVLDVLKNPRGINRDITEHFIRVPSRRLVPFLHMTSLTNIILFDFHTKMICRQLPDYYSKVHSPVDLTQIQQKVTAEEYRSFEEFCLAVELLVENNKSYYQVRFKGNL